METRLITNTYIYNIYGLIVDQANNDQLSGPDITTIRELHWHSRCDSSSPS